MDEQISGTDRDGGVAETGRKHARRTVLVGATSVGVAALAGCLGEDDDVPEPITIDSDQICDHCTMQIGRHPGPVGQTHYDDPEDVVDEERPAQFCSSTCAYTHTFEQEDAGHDPTVIYLTDYSTVDYDVEFDDDIEEISSHLAVDAFASADRLTMVVDSDVQGAMGPSMIGFSDADEAEEFQGEYGGDLYEHADVTAELVISLLG
ncbi:NosL family protein [Natrialba magadii ATCC 43099]|uniref:NosL family protein n=1 Tax=Natrialba magadii (strain ATCC 43099 / DSM 3394 / CCM 3739 / CIP 104546 / IAM 13178 / JCM 8861 / NBRC 102185 / NCIMB 2190 / MS3) TaxID=547559 RepID=D3T020_NATMM|nr:nitrous oxide reductase accessory protein NosL [Natrialba magadii]ADD04378.1 NosL family protein [Natrialba magadii ATCC 43099]ELY26019.1 NosL family protein [Natrialba magadii ATCC 43099]